MMKKNQEKIAVIVGIVILAAIIISVYLTYKPIAKLVCSQGSQSEKDICFLKMAKETNNTNNCDSILNQDLSISCKDKFWETSQCTYALVVGEDCDSYITSEAVRTKNASLCYRVHSNETFNSCLVDMAELSISERKNYCEMCIETQTNEALPPEAQAVTCDNMSCFARYAFEKDDIEGACTLFDDKWSCVDYILNAFDSRFNVTLTSEICNSLSSELKEQCSSQFI